MKIALDARWIFPHISGIGSYTRELIRQWVRFDRENRYLLLFDDPFVLDRTGKETGFYLASNFSTQLLNYGLFSPYNQVRLPFKLRELGVDVYHSTNYMMPLLAGPSRAKRIVTIHDVIPMIFRDHAPRSKKARMYPVYRRLMMEIGTRADAILTDSRSSAADIVSHLRIPPSGKAKVKAVSCGVSDRFCPPSQRSPKPPDEPRVVLYVGRADPYKNLTTLVQAFAAARAKIELPMRLVVAGSPDPRYPEAGELARSLGIADAVRWTGYLADEDLVTLYQQADVLVHPSRYEGFGLQVLEAMACGVPVICSNAASLPEVADEAALLVAPDDVEGFAARMEEVLTRPELSASMSTKGLVQAAKFTWERTARETLRVYKEVLGGA